MRRKKDEVFRLFLLQIMLWIILGFLLYAGITVYLERLEEPHYEELEIEV